jgi:hypothetical protein
MCRLSLAYPRSSSTSFLLLPVDARPVCARTSLQLRDGRRRPLLALLPREVDLVMGSQVTQRACLSHRPLSIYPHALPLYVDRRRRRAVRRGVGLRLMIRVDVRGNRVGTPYDEGVRESIEYIRVVFARTSRSLLTRVDQLVCEDRPLCAILKTDVV